ncbi:ribose-phosphate diphosphokinase [Roseivirga sp. BDSF3-8]|uniref:ribose-phosphate diphosphokinase n=1 Tax=Roseivirga sp. BDSF3-8 TaxID=3241598 RepID=UPI0035324CE6
MQQDFKLFATSHARQLGQTVASELGIELGKLHSETFSDGEVFVRYEESVRGMVVFLVAFASMPYSNLFELFMAIDAARRASAREVICLVPYLPHSRQERKDGQRVSIASRLVADLIQQAGANRMISIDMHANAIEGFYNIPFDHLGMGREFSAHISEQQLDNLCLCSPDFGGLKRIKNYKERMDCEIAVIHKERLRPNQVSHMEIIGMVEGRHVVIIDDMVDTAGTLCKASELIMETGAKSVRAYCTHGLLTGNALERIEKSPLEALIVSDTVYPLPESPKVKVITCGRLLAKAVRSLLSNQSLTAMNPEKL